MNGDKLDQSQGKVDRETVARIEVTAFGVIYGSITVLALLIAMKHSEPRPLETAFILFGSVFAITLAKGFAQVSSDAVRNRKPFGISELRHAWAHSAPTLVAANFPTLLIAGSATNFYSFETGIALAQIAAIWILGVTGYRIGWVIYGKVTSGLVHAAFTAAIGIALAVVKHVVH